MPDLFVDTSGWGNLVDPKQVHHTLATSLYRQARQRGRIVTTNYVIVEVVALLTSPLRISRSRTIEFVNSLRISPYIDILHTDRELDDRAWDFLAARADKTWSLVDCASFVLMRDLGISEALTTGHHFEQAGFFRLLKD